MVGTRGVPARYGGFETCVEEIGSRLAAKGHEIITYCRGSDQRLSTYRGMRLVHLPALRVKFAETPTHSALAAIHLAGHRVDVVLTFNVANAPIVPLLGLSGCRIAIHVDGIEWQRSKWAVWQRNTSRWLSGWRSAPVTA
jgi:hypothetical protein